ncbi:MAG: tRNA epoxyqueuosine(34) reductase QueG, partial [Betaproteobacteria bacterium]|nr:tRNA epoxyqueuosine(34) reductase QueG [Betaproteobacteria bacterium]
DLQDAEPRLLEWLRAGFHGDMDYMAKHGVKRARPAELVPGTVRVIAARLNYLPRDAADSWGVIRDADRAFISRYALGRDYHKVMRRRLQRFAERIEAAVGVYNHRVFTDSAPVMEVEIARKAGLGWRGKHTLLLTRDAGSMFFLGEIYTDLPLPVDEAQSDHCGSCSKCIEVCPTQAIVAPYRLDARRCISYLTIEHHGSIPEALRPLIGNRVYGCDDCQLICPWNRFAQTSGEADFAVRNGLDEATLTGLFGWSASDFNDRLRGSAIHRIGHERWLRNLAVGLGNVPTGSAGAAAALAALRTRADDASALVREHVAWAIRRLSNA